MRKVINIFEIDIFINVSIIFLKIDGFTLQNFRF